MNHIDLLARLAVENDNRIVLLVLDGVGDIRTEDQPATALDRAELPNMDALARRSALGRIVPVATGVTPGSGPGHLALFGYDPTDPEADIGRGVLEALGLGLKIDPGDLAARGNFATVDADGNLTDRRAGRIPTSECQRLVDSLQAVLSSFEEAEIEVVAGEEHRFVLILRGTGYSAEVADTDPQKTGVPPLSPQPMTPEAEPSAALLTKIIASMNEVIADEPRANTVLLRGVSQLPHLPQFPDLYHLRAGAFAGYPLYRGVAGACGMEVVPCGKYFHEIVHTVRENWSRFDFFFMHVKQTDKAGEDGDLKAKIAVLEQVDAALPELLALEPTVLAITGDHSTPAPMASHSWHPVPLLVNSPICFVDDRQELTETAATQGHLGTFPANELMGLLLANASRLAKYGA
jgi:2,3-bisphosphoglycerate-independent phosphoglycerate mutase